jgi:hypothetical protein
MQNQQDKETVLINQINKITHIIERLMYIAQVISQKGWYNAQQRVNFDLNKVHDLTYIFEEKYKDKYHELQQVRFDKYGFVAY